MTPRLSLKTLRTRAEAEGAAELDSEGQREDDMDVQKHVPAAPGPWTLTECGPAAGMSAMKV